jgi:hypothetical protein
MEILKTGIVPTLNQDEWVSEEIPFSSDEINRFYMGGSGIFLSAATRFRMQTGQTWRFFTTEAACTINPVDLNEVKEAIIIANALKSARNQAKLN